MKNLYRFLGLIVLIFICTCAGKKISLRLKLKQGMTYKYRFTTEQNLEGKINISGGVFEEGQEMGWPISITGTVTIETLEN